MARDPAPSAVARSRAAAMRAFDARLTRDQIATIARGIERQRASGSLLAPKKKPLNNALEPIVAVTIPDPA